MCLERVELEPSEQYTATSLNHDSEGKSIFTSIGRLQPQNSCQFLYCIKPVPAIAADLKALKLANNIGKLDIVWRSSNMAERGRLQTSQLQRSVSSKILKNFIEVLKFRFISSLSNTATFELLSLKQLPCARFQHRSFSSVTSPTLALALWSST